MAELPSGTVTFLFTDLEGSTRAWERAPAAMQAAVARHDALLRRAIAAHAGRVVKGTGDGVHAAFARVSAALAASLAAQRALSAEDWGEAGPLRVRMALHSGEAEERAGDYFGPTLNRAARLLAAGHGGQVLLSQATRDLACDALPADVSLRDLGEHRLRDLSRSERVFQLLHPDLPADFPPLRSLDIYPHNLPAPLTSFVGRVHELTELAGRLAATSEARLLTLTGTGGCGKTRLALEVARQVWGQYPDGVWLVELAALAERTFVAQAVAAVLRIPEEPAKPLETNLADQLRTRQLLVVLDNCEHLVDVCAGLVAALLRSCPRLHVLATSREPLGITGEALWPVRPLSTPPPDGVPRPDELLTFEAVHLFVERAKAVRPGFAVTDQNAPAVAEVCRRLDGIPLALELAAARLRALPVEQIAARLEDRFRLLAGGDRAASRRQGTLRAAIDWSYDLLTEGEQALFRQLSVFAGGFTLDAARAVCSNEGFEGGASPFSFLNPPPDLLDLLVGLVDKSLLLVEERDGEARYRLLETLGEYGQERLQGSGQTDQIRSRHAAYYRTLAEEAARGMRGPRERESRDWLKLERDNLRVALRWAEETGEVETGLRLAGALWPLWESEEQFDEGRDWLERLLVRGGEVSASVRATALDGAGTLAARQGDVDRAAEFHAAALALRRGLEDRAGVGHSLNSLANLAFDRGELAMAEALYDEALALPREVGTLDGVTRSLHNLGDVAMVRGDHAKAVARWEESLSLCRQTGNRLGFAKNLDHLGDVAAWRGDYGRAVALYDEAIAMLRDLGAKGHLADVLSRLGYVVAMQGEHERARALHQEVLSLLRDGKNTQDVADTLVRWAQVMAARGERGRAVQLWAAAWALRGIAQSPDPAVAKERELVALRAALGEDAFAWAWAKGRAITLEQTVAYALRQESG